MREVCTCTTFLVHVFSFFADVLKNKTPFLIFLTNYYFFLTFSSLGFNISSPEGALVRVLITTLPKNLRDADPAKHGK